ncbi:claspin-like isoform X2 [Panulirus ornatus]|uniref:claspin-like isoform X2 n=1 Tax=Panulirus ornatus TaxID=150431 RepID=UPI003A854A6A
MEVDQENIESLESLTNFEQEKGIENASSSEDEGIFLSHNPNNVSCNSDAESHSKEEFNKEVKSVTQKPEPEFTSEVTQKPKQEFTSEVTQKPLDVTIDASEPQVMVSDDSSDDDDVSRRLSVGRRKVIVDSDDEDCNVPQLPFVNEPSLMIAEDDDDCDAVANSDKRKRIIKKVNSDSEDESTDLFLRRDSPVQQLPGASQPLYKFNSDLFDAELSDEDQPTKNLEDCLSSAKPHGDDRDSDSIKKNKKQVKHRPPSFKEKQKEVIEIHSETQRMVRESHVSLPYHKPKQRTLSEFLNRRKKTLLPKTNKRSSLKMSMRDMATLRLLEEKKKEVEEFYKSDSDQEDPYDMDWTPDNKAQSQETSSSEVLDVGGDTQADMTDNKSILYPGDELPDLSQVTDSTPDMEMSEVSTLGAQETHKESELLPTQVSEELTISGEGPLVESCDNNDESGILGDVPSLYENLARESENDTSAPAESNANLVDGGTLNKKSPSEEDETCVVNAEVKEFGGGEFLPLSAEDSAQISTDVMTDENTKTDTPKLNLLASRLPDLDLSKIIKETPKLSLGGDDDFIDLEETTPKNTSGVNELMDRFVKHSNTKRKPSEKKQVNLSVVSKEKNAEGEEKLVASNVIVTVDAEEDDQPTDTVPGARFVLLKTALQAKIREQRERERIRRVKEKQFLETEQVIQDDNDLPDEEAELTDQSETEYETESEPEENDIIIKDRKHKKCKYVDDEAEEEEDEDMIDADEGDNSEDENDNRSEVEQSDSNDTIEMPNIEKNIVLSSDEEEEDNEKLRLHWEESQDVHTHAEATSDITSITHSNTEDLFASHTSKKVCSVDKDTSTISVDSSFELFGSVIPGHQPGGGTRHGTGGHCNESDGDCAFLTPFVKTKSSSCSRTPREHDLSLPVEDSQDLFNTTPANAPTSISPNGLSLHLTPIEDSQYPLQESHKKTDPVSMLRLDFSDIGGSQERDDLIGLCSGQFTGKTRSSPMKDLCEDNIDPTQDINELMGLCSGQFASYREEKRSQITKDKGAFSDLVPCQNNPDEHQNAEEELLELCTAKFTTQITQEESSSALDGTDKPESGLAKGLDEDEDTGPAQMIVFSSDEEGMANRQVIVKKRKKRKRIVEFSDDEDAQDAIVFDDEENEIPRTTFSGFKDRQKGGIRADFLENEAELSGSDANSDDEDEDDADSMEEEEGDHEHYDENELRNQVGRAHMKTLLDSDKQQIRLLQEMYLEDGELHGEGRQRQFRWKNVDNDSDDNEKKLQSDDEEGGDEEMEDAEWRKQRFEREKFLNEQRAKAEHNEAEVFKVGLRPNVRSSSLLTETSTKREPLKTVNPIPVPTTALKSQPTAKNPFCMPSKRGSFLSRDKTTLARIAEFTKDKGTVVGGAKQGGNFVFQHLSAEEVQKMESTKLKRTQSLPTTKRTKLDRSLSMDASNKKSSSIFRYF